MNDKPEMINVSVVYALADRQLVLDVACGIGTSIREAVVLSGILDACPEIDLDKQQVGIYGFRHNPDLKLQEGDRIEIYRPLELSPTEARRLRAKTGSN